MNVIFAEADSHGARLEPLFDVAFAAPGGVARLRQLILTLAFQGKLVPQDPKEAPASELVKQIMVAKTALVKAGLIRMPKPLEPIANADRPYEIPANWEWVRLGGIGLINPRNDVDDDQAEAGFVPMSLIPEGYETGHGLESRKWGDIKKGYTHFANGDVGMAKITPCFENGKSCIFSGLPNGIGAGTTELHVFRNAFNSIAQRYLLYFLKNPAFIDKAAGTMTGSAGQKRVPTPYFTDLAIPLPPLEEQKRIVTRVDELMLRCDQLESKRSVQEAKRREARVAIVRQWLAGDDAAAVLLGEHFATLVSTREDVAELRKAILQSAVMGKLVSQDASDVPASELLKQIAAKKAALVKAGRIRTPKPLRSIENGEKPYAIPAGWEWVRFGELVEVLNGRAYKQNELLDKGTPVLRVGNLFTSKHWYYSNIELEDDKYIDLGDLIYAWSASFGPFIWDGERVIYHYHIWKLRFFVEDSPVKRFLYNFLLNETEAIKSSGNGIAMLHMTKERMEKLSVPLPPLAEQKRIVTRIDTLMHLCDTLEQGIDTAQAKQTELLGAVMAIAY